MKRHGTCIVGIKDKGGVYIGADSCGSDNWFRQPREDRKLFRIGDDILVGSCGSFRVRDVLAYHVTAPERPKDIDGREYVVRLLIPEIRRALNDAGALAYAQDRTESIDGAFLLAYDGALYCVEEDLQVGVTAGGIATTGSGYEYALGSLFSSKHIKDAKKRIRLALEAAAHFAPSVGPPFHIEKL